MIVLERFLGESFMTKDEKDIDALSPIQEATDLFDLGKRYELGEDGFSKDEEKASRIF